MPTTSSTPLTVEALLGALEEWDSEVVFLKLMVDKLTLQLLRARRAQFGRSSEQLDDPQIALIEGAPLYEQPAPKAAAKPEAANSATLDRQLPEHLPRENHVHRPDATDAAMDSNGNACGCTACGGRLRQIGADVSEQLEYVPSRFKVIRHARPKLACVSCQAIFQAPAPSRPITRGVAGPALLANVLVSKYCDHIPLHRLARIHARDGVCFDPSTTSILPHVQSGKVRLLGVSSAERSLAAPSVPTIAEQGLPGFEALTWAALMVPVGTPPRVVGQLNAAANSALSSKEVLEHFARSGSTPKGGSAAAFGVFLRQEVAKWGKAGSRLRRARRLTEASLGGAYCGVDSRRLLDGQRASYQYGEAHVLFRIRPIGSACRR